MTEYPSLALLMASLAFSTLGRVSGPPIGEDQEKAKRGAERCRARLN